MSQTDSGTSILERAKETANRNSLLKELVLQCVQQRGEASDGNRVDRQITLRKLAFERGPLPVPAKDLRPDLSRPNTDPGLEPRIASLEVELPKLREILEGFASRILLLDQKADVLRSDLRNLDLSSTRMSEQFKAMDQIFASLGRDANKLSHSVEGLSLELQMTKAQVKEVSALQDRLSRLEAGLARAIDLLQSPDHGIADVSLLRDRFSEIETGMERVLKAVECLQRPPEVLTTDSEREATAKVLASLTKLVEGMRNSQAQRQVQKGGLSL
jgi:chromosome segregation ATPase